MYIVRISISVEPLSHKLRQWKAHSSSELEDGVVYIAVNAASSSV